MSARVNREIELLPREEWEKGSFGKFINWALSVGKYVIIGTELVVVAAFLSRFKFDRDLANLYEEIRQKQAIVEANQEFEREFRFLQARLTLAQELQVNQQQYSELIDELAAQMPPDVSLKDISLQEGSVKLTANALSEVGLETFLNNLGSCGKFEQINLTDVSSGSKNNEVGISFSLSGDFLISEKTKSTDSQP